MATLPQLPRSPLLTWSSPADADLPGLHRLVTAIADADADAERWSQEDVRDLLHSPWLDPVHDSVVGLDTDGTPRAYGVCDLRPGDAAVLRVGCWGGVDPSWRQRGIGRAVLDWQVGRARDLVAARRAQLAASGAGPQDVAARAVIAVQDGVDGAASLAAAAGMRTVRWFAVMRRDLTTPLPAVATPAPLRVVAFDGALDEATRMAHNDAFADHWGSQPWTAETWGRWETGHRCFRPDWSFLALDGDTVAGYVLSAAHPDHWAALGYRQGWTNKLGVRAPWRGRGVAKALLAAAMRAYSESGMAYAGLDVDADNPTGAVALYLGLGYEVHHRIQLWSLDL